jgi:hypothetical protein
LGLWLTAAGMLFGAAAAAADCYEIEPFSPASWSRFYTLTGLGNVDPRPLSEEEQRRLEAHCRELTRLTDHAWHPLGYSMELGYKLCYRTEPFSQAEAEVFCQRLEMKVKRNSPRLIVCGG